MTQNRMVRLGIAAFVTGILTTGYAVYISEIRPAIAQPAAFSNAQVLASLRARLPKTQVSSVDCAKLAGVCEVVAGPNLFYTDPGARYLVIGRVYDMETRQDLTAARLLELAPGALVAASARTQNAGEGEGGQAAQTSRPTRLPLAELPTTGAIHWGPRAGTKVVVFSDLRCGYCRRLEGDLRKLGLRVEERPISVLGTRALSEAVYCAPDPASALAAVYAGEEPHAGARCDTSGLDANEAFARKHGLTGTPVVVRASDGAVIEGYRPAAAIAAWLKGARA